MVLICMLALAILGNAVVVHAAVVQGQANLHTEPYPSPGEQYKIVIQYSSVYGEVRSIKDISFKMVSSSGITIDSITSYPVCSSSSSATTGTANFSGNTAKYIQVTVWGSVRTDTLTNQQLDIGTATIVMSDSSKIEVGGFTCGIPLTLPHTHTMEKIASVAATCTAPGSSIWQCTSCEYSEQRTVEPLDHNCLITGNDPTCEAEGVRYSVCQRMGCGYTLTEKLKKAPCSYGPDITIEATCETGGQVKRICSVCSGEEIISTIPILTHDYTFELKREDSTCTKAGYVILECDRTDCTSTIQQALLLAQHQNEELIIPATCENSGSSERKCCVCGKEEVSHTGPPLGHDFTVLQTRVESTCKQVGYVIMACSRTNCIGTRQDDLESVGHQYEETVKAATCDSIGYFKSICTTCGDILFFIEKHPNGHSYEQVLYVPSTCHTAGQAVQECINDGCDKQIIQSLALAEHDYHEEEEVAATCTFEGRIVKRCKNCPKVVELEVFSALGHLPSGWVNSEPSDCTQGLRQLNSCARCSYMETRDVAAKPHDYDVPYEAIAPKCGVEGELAQRCMVCGSIWSYPAAALDHTWGPWEMPEDADCVSGWTESRACKLCSLDATRRIDAAQHKFAPFVVTNEPTCLSEGLQHQTCEVCGHSCNERIPVVPHVLGMPYIFQEATCEDAGILALDCSICGYVEMTDYPALGHKFTQWHKPVDSSCLVGWIETSSCDHCDKPASRYIDAQTHAYSPWQQEIAATCYGEGEKYRTCTNCANKEDVVLPIVSHTYSQPYVTKEETCSAEGEVAVSCTVCKIILETRPSSKLPHAWTSWDVEKAPTCTEGGSEARRCANCNESENHPLPPCGHQPKEWKTALMPTCEMAGEKHSLCSVCDDSLVESLVALGHKWGDFEIMESPGCETTGAEVRRCSACNCTEIVELEMLHHRWGSYLEIHHATCTREGLYHRLCETCGHIDPLATDIEAHEFGPWGKTQYDDCSLGGVQQCACVHCGALESREVDPANHWFAAYQTESEPSCDKEGKEMHECKRCGFAETRQMEKLHHDFCPWGKTQYEDCTLGGVQKRSCDNCGLSESRERDPVKHWFAAYQIELAASCETAGSRSHTCRRCGYNASDSVPAKGHRLGRLKIVKRALPYRPGVQGRICKVCGTVLDIRAYMPSNEALKVVFSPLGIAASSIASGQTDLWYMLVPVDITEPHVFTLPLVADNQDVVGELEIRVSAHSISVTPSYFDDRTLPLGTFLHFFSSVQDITANRIKYRYHGFDLEEPVALSRFAGQDTVLMYLRIEGIYDDRREVNSTFDLAHYEVLLQSFEKLLEKMQK